MCGSDPTRHHTDHMDLVRLGTDPISLGELIADLTQALMNPTYDLYVVRSCVNTKSDQLLPNATQRQRQLLFAAGYKLRPDGSVDRSWNQVDSLMDKIVNLGGQVEEDLPPDPPEVWDNRPDAPEPPDEEDGNGYSPPPSDPSL